MFAVPFDIKRLAITGRETPVIEGIFYNTSGGFADYAFSNSGLLLYMAETRPTNLSTLDWLDHNGTSQTVSAPPQIYGNIRLSPNGQRADVNITAGAGAARDIWIIDLMRGTLNRLTSEGINDNPIWTMDGRRVAFYSTQGSFQPTGIYWAAADASSKPELLLATNIVSFPDSWTPDGRTLLYHSTGPAHIWVVQPTGNGGDGNPRLLFERSAFNETQAQVSPDGRWVAYVSDESGKSQIYVRAFPGPGGKLTIAVEGGKNPRWSRGGRERFYLNPAKSQVMAVEIQAGPMFRVGQPHALFEQRNPDWDVAPDGQHFLVRKQPQTVQNEAKLQVVVNWFDELRRRVPVGK
jgi:Tol biopolymer transport system component